MKTHTKVHISISVCWEFSTLLFWIPYKSIKTQAVLQNDTPVRTAEYQQKNELF